MKLTDINLNDQTELAAAHALLSAILGRAVITETPTVTVASERSPAEVFGGAAAPAPLSTPALSTAGAEALPTVPAGLPGTSAAQSPVSPPPAHYLAPAANVPGGAAAALMPPAQTAGEGVDAEGLPWDERIHAGSKTKTQKGVWTAKRSLNDEAFVNGVKAELRARMGGAAAPAPLPTAQLPAPNVVASPTSSPLPVATGAPSTFEQLMPRVTGAIVAGLLPQTILQQACAHLGLASIVELHQKPEFVPMVWATLQASYPALV